MERALSILAVVAVGLASSLAEASDETYWMKIKAKDKIERTRIANIGAVIEFVGDDYVIALGNEEEFQAVEKTGKLEQSFIYNFALMDFPPNDANFHNYNELLKELKDLADSAPDIVKYEVIGKSLEGRDIVNLRISTDLPNSHLKPAVSFLGTHHAREHLSTEVPLLLAHYLVDEFKKDNLRIINYLHTREINIMPLVNPDGSEYDIASGRYQAWRKNRARNNDGSYGVDLNRNYGYMWGSGGSSTNPRSDVFMGPRPFSEPETQAVKAFVEGKTNITTLLTFHTYSELILYPWGHKYDSIETARDLKVFQTMASTMAQWNQYTPQQASDLYIASGDTTDWAYGAHKIFAFTFELDPKNSWGTDGFYPGQAKIPVAFRKNLEPCLYLIEHADNPYRVADGRSFGIDSALLK